VELKSPLARQLVSKVWPLWKMRVLIVEDQALVALTLMDSLQEAGHDVVGPAFTSDEALSFLAQGALDAAFVDVDLERPDIGLEVAEQLEKAHVLVIFTTAQPERVRACGRGTGLFTKPYNTEDAPGVLRLRRDSAVLDYAEQPAPSSFEWLSAHTETAAGPRNILGSILLVEDHPHDLALSLAALESADMANPIVVARDGEQAMDELLRASARHPAERPALVLLDLKMSRVDGFEVLQRAREKPELRNVPIVVFTSSQDPADIRRSYEYGAKAVLVKPQDYRDYKSMLIALSQRWIRHSPALTRPQTMPS
jgi:CheY-like chemotaxis protein